ncbi:hypothetical protein PQX77_002612 [Marasmius sp. AFHP31]|nr:hypothetical protein PQX77_002612 [Marasmius sp. AFHP31]
MSSTEHLLENHLKPVPGDFSIPIEHLKEFPSTPDSPGSKFDLRLLNTSKHTHSESFSLPVPCQGAPVASPGLHQNLGFWA